MRGRWSIPEYCVIESMGSTTPVRRKKPYDCGAKSHVSLLAGAAVRLLISRVLYYIQQSLVDRGGDERSCHCARLVRRYFFLVIDQI